MASPGHRIVTFFIRSFLLICTTVILSCGNNVPRMDENTLAVIGDQVIDTDYFVKRYQDFRSRTGVGDKGQVRRSVLKNIINEELLINEARQRGYDKDSAGQHERERIKIQELLNAYHQEMIADKIEVEEEELKRLFIRLNTKIKARHLYASTYEEAAYLYQALQEGKTFDELAKDVFNDPVLRNSGGQLGYFSVDEMDPAFEEAAYELEVGEISNPIRTNDGYSIIKVEDRQVKPLLTEYEYAKHRSRLLPYWKKRKIEKTTQEHVNSLKKSLNIQFNERVLEKLFLVLSKEKGSDFSIAMEITSGGIGEIKNEELVRSDVGIWDIKEFQERAKYTSEKQRNWIRNKQSLKDFISGLIVRTRLLTEAQKLNLYKTSHYKDQVEESFDTYLLERIQKDIYQEIIIPEDSLQSYFNQDPTRFADPPQVNLREIVLENADDTILIASQLQKSTNFSDLARKYSVRRWSAENDGELGYLTPGDLGKWSQLAFSLDVGKWVGPVKMDSYYVFLQCIGKAHSKPRSFEEARSDVEEALRTMSWEREKSKRLSEIQKNIYTKSFPEKLLTIRTN